MGAAAATLMPLVDAVRSHVFAAEGIHADDTTVPVLAKGKTHWLAWCDESCAAPLAHHQPFLPDRCGRA